MAHELTQYDQGDPLPEVEVLAGDNHTLAFKVVDANGTGVDISSATLSWELVEREYESGSAAVLDDSDASVTIDTSAPVDPSVGEWEVHLDGTATDRWGTYHHRPQVEAADGSVASWRGTLIVEA